MRTRTWILLAVLAIAPTVTAQAHEGAGSGLDKRIDLSLAGAAATDVLTSFGAIAGMEVELDPELEGQVTIELSNVTARTTLDVLCEMLDCKWWLEDGPPQRLRVKANAGALSQANQPRGTLDTQVSLALAAAPAEDVFESFASIGGWKLEMERPLVTVEFEDVMIRDALDIVCRAVECTWKLDQVGGEGVLRIEWSE